MSLKKIYNENPNNNNPHERYGHICQVIYGTKLVLWGGSLHDNDADEGLLKPNMVYVFNTDSEKWFSVNCNGECPPLVAGASFLSLQEKYLYLFGGIRRTGDRLNDLYRLDVDSFEWTKVEPLSDQRPSPRDKMAGWEHDDKLYYFGGFGDGMDNFLNKFGQFDILDVQNELVRGWNNQLVCFNTLTLTWHEEKCIHPEGSEEPRPRAAHSCTKLNDNQVILFGGRTQAARQNDLYILDLNTFKWSKNLNTQKDSPIGRSWHTFTKLNDTELFLFGGISQESIPLSDGWLFNTKNLGWTRVQLDFGPRLWHTCVMCDSKSKQGVFYMFGGSESDIFNNQIAKIYPNYMLKINITPDTLKRKCVDVIKSNKRGSKVLDESQEATKIPRELKRLLS